MEEQRCVNCNGTLKMYPEKGLLICEYCDSTFEMHQTRENSKESSTEKEVCLALQLLDLSECGDFTNEYCKNAFTEMCGYLNNGETVEAYLDALKILSKNHKEWALNGVNTSLLDKIQYRICPFLSQGEEYLFYKDSGVFSKGKTGMLITNKQILYIKKNQIDTISLLDIDSIYFHGFFGDGECYFNGKDNVKVDNMVCNYTERAMIMGLICTLIRECHGAGYKIKIIMN